MIKIILGQGVDVEHFASEISLMLGFNIKPNNQPSRLPYRQLYDSIWMLDYENNHWLRQLQYDGSWVLEARYDVDRKKLVKMIVQIQKMDQVTTASIIRGYD